MDLSFRIHTDELDEQLLRRLADAIRAAYQGQVVELNIHVPAGDETDYLNASEANRRQLEAALARIAAGEPAVAFDAAQFRRDHQL